MENFRSNQPIIIGLAGKAGSGKTSVAESIIPKGSLEAVKFGYRWDHLFFALPLYEMASIKKNIMGANEKSRKLFALHETLYDLYGGSAIGNMPDYNKFVQMVNEIESLPIEPEGIKPRTFLQKAGDICRQDYPECFAHWAIIKSYRLYNQFCNESEDIDDAKMAIIISDVRYPNEAAAIQKQPNGVVICFDASEETLNNRLLKRDGQLPTKAQSQHASENGIDEVKQMANIIINTDNMSLEDQTLNTLLALGMKVKTNA
jgi:dephospho-CoA kinase